MSIPPPFAGLDERIFSFSPPILGIDGNEWLLKECSWSELVVAHQKTGDVVAIPRRQIATVNTGLAGNPVVELCRELEYRMGAVWPVRHPEVAKS